jgi:endonuclease/exonuclease/phosphatase family metal-dependent hydrolase
MHAKWTRSVGDLKRAALLRRHHVEMRTDVNDFTRESYIGRHCGDTSLRVATFNLFNLQMQWGTRKAMAARALAAVAPDIIALQEVRFSTDKHQAFEIQQFLLSENGQLAYPHLIYQRVSSQDIGREEGLAVRFFCASAKSLFFQCTDVVKKFQILSRHPVLVWGFCVLTTNAQASPVQWFSDSGLDAPSVPDHSRIVLFARINTVIDALSPMKSTIVDVFVTHWPVADRDQCAAAMQSIAFADFVWRHKQVVGSPIIPQILTGDLNVYIDFEWPVDLVTGQVLSSDVNKCWQFWQSNFDAFQRTSGLFTRVHVVLQFLYQYGVYTEKVWFRDSFDSLFPELTYTNPHICSEKQRSASLSGLFNFVATLLILTLFTQIFSQLCSRTVFRCGSHVSIRQSCRLVSSGSLAGARCTQR